MALIVSMVSQKGGVGKSILARLMACIFASLGWKVKIADLDIGQGTIFHWRTRRLENKIEPDVPVEQFGTVDKALALGDQYDMLILDGAPHATSSTRAMAEKSHLTAIPTGLSLDDLVPAVVLAHDLVKHGVPRERIVFVLCRVGDSEIEIQEARAYLEKAGYDVLPGAIPEMTGYRRANDKGRALTETSFKTLNQHAEEVAQGIVDRISQLTSTSTKKRSIA
jgi:chromosome partitioning protein